MKALYCATGSAAFGGLAAVLESIDNVILMPLHARLWEGVRPAQMGQAA